MGRVFDMLDRVLPSLILAGWVVLAIDLLVLLPAAFIRRTRRFSGLGLFVSSYFFGLILWLAGLSLTYSLWGLTAVIVGLIIFGVGVVPMAMLATLFKGMWDQLLPLVVLTILTFGARLAGAALRQDFEHSSSSL